jgi:hypothetical protein
MMPSRRAWLVAAFFALACVPGPFEHASPYDPRTTVTGTLEVLTDTVSVVGEIAETRLVTEPAFDVAQHPPVWRSESSHILESLGDGRFRLLQVPAVPTPVEVVAIYPTLRFSAIIVAGRP